MSDTDHYHLAHITWRSVVMDWHFLSIFKRQKPVALRLFYMIMLLTVILREKLLLMKEWICLMKILGITTSWYSASWKFLYSDEEERCFHTEWIGIFVDRLCSFLHHYELVSAELNVVRAELQLLHIKDCEKRLCFLETCLQVGTESFDRRSCYISGYTFRDEIKIAWHLAPNQWGVNGYLQNYICLK